MYTADGTRIYIYNRDKQEPIFTYERESETRLMSESMPQFIHDQTVVFTTSKYAIGFDLQNEKKIFHEECQNDGVSFALQKPVVHKGSGVFLGD